MTTHVSILSRALLAVVLMIGFYLLALAISAGLLYIPYAEVVYAHRVTPKFFLICILGALAILWAILPRFDKFPAPGPQLTRDKHPRLFDELEKVAHATGQAMPVEVYAVPDVNAWVAQRGGIMGFGSRRVMGLGLPLMHTLTCSQFRAVLAHEFGHFHSGDTRVGPWIFKTRDTITRTLGSLGRSKLQLPFIWYGNMFLRVTHAISRRQEFVADELAARTVGAKPLADGLRTVHGTGMAFNAYWRQECAPVLHAGFRPPLVEGFSHFIRVDEIAQAINKHVDETLQNGKGNPYDTHPPLKDRLAAVASLPPGEIPANDPPAISLLKDIPALESELLSRIAGPEAAQKLKPVLWKDVGTHVWLTQWKQLVKANAAALKGITPESLPRIAGDAKQFGLKLVDLNGMGPADGRATAFAGFVLGAAFTVLLLENGASIDTTPGNAPTLTKGETTIEPFGVVNSLAAGKITAETWTQQCAALGITGSNLGIVA